MKTIRIIYWYGEGSIKDFPFEHKEDIAYSKDNLSELVHYTL